MAKRRLYSGPVLVLGAVAFIETLAFALPYSYFPNYAISLGASVASIGLFTSSFMLTSAMLASKLGGLSDKFGRKKIILWGLFGDVIFGSLTGLAPSWHWLLLIRTLNGAVTAAATIPAEALLIDEVSPDKWGEASGFIVACQMVGRRLGPGFGGVIQFTVSTMMSVENSYRVPYFADSALAALAMLLVAWKIKEGKNSVGSSNFPAVKRKNNPIKLSRSLKIVFFCAFVTGMGAGFIVPVSVLFYQDKFGAEPVEIGAILSLSGFIGLFSSWIAGRISDRLGRKPVIAIGGISARLCGIALPFTMDLSQATFFLSFRSFGFDMYNPGMRALRADLTPEEERGRTFGMYRAFLDMGEIIGPVMATYLYDIYRFQTINVGFLALPGYGVPFFVNSALGLLALAILLIFVKEPKKREM